MSLGWDHIHILCQLYNEEMDRVLSFRQTPQEKLAIDCFHRQGASYVNKFSVELAVDYNLKSCVMHQNHVYVYLIKFSGQKYVQKLEENNGFHMGGRLDVAGVPQDRWRMLLSNQSFLFILTHDSERFFSVFLFKDSQQVKEISLDLPVEYLIKPVVTNCSKLMLAEERKILTIFDLQRDPVIPCFARIQCDFRSYAFLELTESDGYLVVDCFCFSKPALFIYKMELQARQSWFDLTLTQKLDAGLFQLCLEPSVGKTVLVRGIQKNKEQRAFTTLVIE